MIPLTLFTRPRWISRIHAFQAQGVTLRFPERSWSGVRASDRSIVIAMREVDVSAHVDGYRCLLWSPALRERGAWLDRPSQLERLQHCRLAALHGNASGLITHGAAAEVEPEVVVSVRVVAYGNEYWATWGRLARAQGTPRFAPRMRATAAYR